MDQVEVTRVAAVPERILRILDHDVYAASHAASVAWTPGWTLLKVREAIAAAWPEIESELRIAARSEALEAAAVRVVRVRPGDPWPEAVSDGLTLTCHDCGEVPRFDYTVEAVFWERWVPGPERTSVVCLPCLDRRCGGEGLGEAIVSVHWTGTGHTVCLVPDRVVIYNKG